MGEIDTKSIESVQAALSLFGQKNDQRKHRSISTIEVQFTKFSGKMWSENQELLLTDLANYKVQVEVKEYAYKQALLKLESYNVTVDELSAQLKNCEAERDQAIEDSKEVREQIDKLESKVKEMSDLLLEARIAQEQLVHVINELNATKEELRNAKAELSAAEESKVSAMKEVELMATAVDMEKEKTEELLTCVSEFNDAVLLSKVAAIEAENKYSIILSEKEKELQVAAVHAQEQLEEMIKRTEMMQDLENHLSERTLFIDSLQSELEQVKELHASLEEAASNAMDNLDKLRSELKLLEKENSDQARYIISMETELRQSEVELKSAKEESILLNHELDMLRSEILKAKSDTDEISGKESAAQVEIALLKAQVHKGRSMIAAAEAAEERAKSVKSGQNIAVKQLAIEADKAKKETEKVETRNGEKLERDDSEAQVTISAKEYESLIQKAQEADQVAPSSPHVTSHLIDYSDTERELHALKTDLEAAEFEIRELKSVAKNAVNRAEQAEKAKTAVEAQLRKWREQKQKRREAAAEESTPKGSNLPKTNIATYNKTPTPYQPLSKILNMKF
ncbi:hypothetical protein IFM89_034403 [Coptis chinensis]|uniref:Uncharacterized protein n=1 Tax=Coptis chinensis TaxID=261450 RepID=A0A835MGN4_9MAGN|nr:hypothetical protein IFM89_034403 [Coptis chinensis]